MSQAIKAIPQQQPDAGFWLRVVAKLIDQCLLNLFDFFLIALGVWLNARGMPVWIILVSVIASGVLWYAYIYCMTLTRGQTVGKIFAGIRVETTEGTLPKPGQLARRVFTEMAFDLLIVLSVLLALGITRTMKLAPQNFNIIIAGFCLGQLLAWINVFAIAFTKQRQAIHDLVAQTYVVKIREGSRAGLWIATVVIFMLCNPSMLLRQYIMEAHYIPSESMTPTILGNDRIVANKLTLKRRMPRYDEIVTFNHNTSFTTDKTPVLLVKRVAGLPGDKLQVKDGRLYRNGQAVNEPYIAEPMHYTWPEDAAKGGVIKVPPDHIVVMGDNRNNSNDAHLWQSVSADGTKVEATPFLPVKDLKGIMIYRFWPVDRIGPMNNPVQ